MYYRTKRSVPGFIFISNSYHQRKYIRGQPREPKRERTPEEMEKQNARNRATQCQLLILANFRNGFHITLTYPKEERPPDVETAKRILRSFHSRMKRRYQAAGLEYKWLLVTEIGARGAIHHHLVIEDIQIGSFSTVKAVRECWNGGKYITPMYEEGEYRALSEYLVKKESKEEIKGCKLTHSRNLIMPKTTRKKRRGNSWLADPRIPKGWELVKDSLYNGVNAYTGLPYQQYLIARIEGGEDAGKDLHLQHDKEHPPGGRSRPVCAGNGDTGEGGYSLWGDLI